MSDWLPIESAPKDGAWFLGIMSGHHPKTGEAFVPAVVHYIEDIGWTEKDEGEENEATLWELTHWQPSPHRPQSEATTTLTDTIP